MDKNTSHISAMAAGLGTAAALVVLFVLCALVQAIAPGLQLSHMWVSLFTSAPIGSVQAWIEGLLGSIVAGWIAGFVFALKYNWFVSRKR